MTISKSRVTRATAKTSPPPPPPPPPTHTLEWPDGIARYVASCGHEIETKKAANPIWLKKHAALPCWRCRELAQFEANGILSARAKAARQAAWDKALDRLPVGTTTMSRRDDDGTWTGELAADGIIVRESGGPLMGLFTRLTKRWLAEKARREAANATPS